MRITLDLPDETIRQLKTQAAINSMKLKELVTLLIHRGLAAGIAAPVPAPQRIPLPVAIQRFSATSVAASHAAGDPIPIAREADGTVTPYLTNADLYAILDEEDLAQYQRVLSGTTGQ